MISLVIHAGYEGSGNDKRIYYSVARVQLFFPAANAFFIGRMKNQREYLNDYMILFSFS